MEGNDSLIAYDQAIPVKGAAVATYRTKLILKAFDEPSKVTKNNISPREEEVLARKRKERTRQRKNAGATGGLPGTKLLDVESALNILLPPKVVQSQGIDREKSQEKWVQFASKTKASRDQVIQLDKTLNAALENRQARSSGICPVKEELWSECFDELLRQVTLDSPERGLLLMRVRDELRMTLAAYRTLYESSTSFGGRKASSSATLVTELEASVQELEHQVEDLGIQVMKWQNKASALKRDEQEKSKVRREKMSQETEKIKQQTKIYQDFLDQQ